MFVDSHSHINEEHFINEPHRYIEEAAKEGVKAFLIVGWDLISSIAAVNIANQYPNCYAAIGIHPSDIKKMKENDFNEIEHLVDNRKVVAIGEIGLDFYYEDDDNERKKQEIYFNKFINLANAHNLPIVVHSREASEKTLNILKDNPPSCGGVMHCYAGSKEQINDYVNLGMYFGIGGVLTFKSAVRIKEALEEMPLDRIILETDAPYLAPTPHRGEVNHSKYIPIIANEVARIKILDIKEIEKETTKNFEKLFRVKL